MNKKLNQTKYMNDVQRIKVVAAWLLLFMGCAALFNGVVFCSTQVTQLISGVLAVFMLAAGYMGLMKV